MTKLTLGPWINPAEFTYSSFLRAMRPVWESPDAKHTYFPVAVPVGAFPESLPCFVHIDEFASEDEAEKRRALAPEGWRVVGHVGRFLLMEPSDRVTPDERVLRIHPDQEIEYRLMPNFLGAERYGAREPLPNEIGLLAKTVTTTYGIGNMRSQHFGDVLCRVEADPDVGGSPQ